MPEKTLERLSGRIKALLWRGRTHMVIIEKPPQKAAAPYGLLLTHMSRPEKILALATTK